MNLDFFNSIGNILNDGLFKLDKQIHNQSKSTFVDNFIHELRHSLNVQDNIYRLNKLPKDTIFSVNELEDEFISCYANEVHYDIPRAMVDPNIDNITGNERLQFQDGIYRIINPNSLNT